MQLAERLNTISESQTIKMSKLSRELKAQGLDVIDLSIGEPDFDTPEHIKEAAKKAIDEGYTHYTPVPGYMELRQAIAKKLKRDNQLDYPPEQIITSTGAKQSLANAILSVVNPGDEVIIPTPYWVTYSELVKFAGGKVIAVRCPFEKNFKMSPQQLEEAINDKTRLLMFSSPCNPSGSIYNKEELAALAAVLKKYPDVYIISDEIYEYINYVGRHESIAQFDFLKNRILLINGVSKGYAMTGWRLGYLAGPLPVIKACDKIQGQFTSATSSITQRAAITALTADSAPTQAMTAQFNKRKSYIVSALKEIEGLEVNDPDGAFYVFPKISAYFGKKAGDTEINNAGDLSMYLLQKAHVSTVGGDAFGEPDCIRISYANSMKNIEEAVNRIKKVLAALK